MMIRALGEYQRSPVLVVCSHRNLEDKCTYIFRVFIPCTLCNDDILQWNCGHQIMYRAVEHCHCGAVPNIPDILPF